ncbi:MAG: DUF202 domain-containing protein [Nanoarchaeota archaeon]
MRSRKKTKLKLEEETALLANERTLLSYVRTTFSALILGFALIQFSTENSNMAKVGIATIIGGFILGVIGLIEYNMYKKRIHLEAEE